MTKYIIREQTEWVALSVQELAELLRNESAFRTKMSRQGCELKKVGTNSWFKKCSGGTQQPPPPPNTPTALTKYVGTYDGKSVLFPSFDIVEKDSKLYIKKVGIEAELTNEGEDSFKGTLGTDFRIVFRVVGQQATGGVIIIGNDQTEFSRKTSGSGSGLNWMEIAKGTWDALKKAGYWVKEEGGKLWAAVQDGLHVKQEDLTTWKCVDNYLKSQGFYKLLDGSDGTKKWKYTPTNFKADGKSTFIVYFQDGRVEIRYQDGFKTVQGYTGKWQCGKDDKSFKIVWDDGEEQVYGQFQPFGPGSNQQSGGQGSNINNTTGAPKIQSFSQVCSAVLACPKIDDVKQGKKMYKVCMKCPEIQQFQEMSPLFKQIYFDLLEENGKKQQADQYFGPIMQAAIRNFQETIDKDKFLTEWGMIGQNTLSYLSKQPDVQQQTPTQQTQQQQTPTIPKYELTQDKIVTNQTKF